MLGNGDINIFVSIEGVLINFHLGKGFPPFDLNWNEFSTVYVFDANLFIIKRF